MTSLKTTVIEHLFFERHDPVQGIVTPDVVTFDDIVDAIRATRVALSMANPANFWKDITRTPNAELLWPDNVLSAGYTGDDAIGSTTRACFRFIKLPPGQTTAFPPPPTLDAEVAANPLSVQSVSLTADVRGLARDDAAWLAEVAERLRLVESHFALVSARNVTQVDFLQAGLRLPGGAVDLVYLLRENDGSRWLVAVESKARRDAIWVPQISRTAALMSENASSDIGAQGVIPFAIKAIAPSVLQTVEFAPSRMSSQLTIRSQGAFRLEPAVRGIG